MKDMKMKTKMIMGFGILIVLTIINVVVGMSSLRDMSTRVDDMQHEQATKVEETMKEIGANEEKANLLLDAIADVQKDDMAKINRSTTLSNWFSFGLVAVSIIITLIISTSLIKSISRSVRQLSDAAKDIAMGRVDIEMVKHNNDEFGELVDEYTKVIENMKYQARIAEAVSHGDLTIQVRPNSEDDVLGNALKKLVDDNYNALSSISDAGSHVTVSSSEVASASQALAQGSTEQALSLIHI